MRCTPGGCFGLALAAALAGCAHAPPTAPGGPVARAATWLEGRFDNRVQATADPDYVAVSVRWTPIWRDRDDGRWFLVEQAAGDGEPYRRRVHRLRDDGTGGVISDVYLPPAPDASAGGGEPAALQPADLLPMPGCEVWLVSDGDALIGGTRGRDCPSRLRGARWTSAEVRITADGFDSWDRGFDDEGRQVWGATDGPYRFRRH